ncbi:hypothetical protein CGCF413_v009762 [Colletotrichum fructicola]|nr:hypothetical protein CGCF413_v009762 [Colletotrichum fructicola]
MDFLAEYTARAPFRSSGHGGNCEERDGIGTRDRHISECFISACRDINPPYHLSHPDSRTAGCTKPPGLLSCSPPTGISAGHSFSRTGILSGSLPSLS